jgi:hypothetical protein
LAISSRFSISIFISHQPFIFTIFPLQLFFFTTFRFRLRTGSLFASPLANSCRSSFSIINRPESSSHRFLTSFRIKPDRSLTSLYIKPDRSLTSHVISLNMNPPKRARKAKITSADQQNIIAKKPKLVQLQPSDLVCAPNDAAAFTKIYTACLRSSTNRLNALEISERQAPRPLWQAS